MFQSTPKPLRRIVSGIAVKQLIADVNRYHHIKPPQDFAAQLK